MRNLSLLVGFLTACLVGGAGCDLWPSDLLSCRGSGRCEPLGFVLGQRDAATSHLPTGLVTPHGILQINGRLFLSDCSNNRVLIWNRLPTQNQQVPDQVLGQPSLTTHVPNHGGVSARSMSCPSSLGSDGTRLMVADRGNHRVLIWKTLPTTDFAPADAVLGQPSFTSGTENSGTGTGPSRVVSAQGFDSPEIFLEESGPNQQLYVADEMNHRVLLFRSEAPPNYGFLPATVVLGQMSMTTRIVNAGAVMPMPVSASGLFRPTAVWSSNGKLLVADRNNNRVLIWNTLPRASFASADVVLGQQQLTTLDPLPRPSPAAATLYQPRGLLFSGNRLFVADSAHDRILVWSGGIPTSNGAPATLVLGQSSLSSSSVGMTSATSLQQPRHLSSDGTNLIVSDEANNRVLLWNTIPVASGQPAGLVLGQPDFTSSLLNNPGSVSAEQQSGTNSLALAGKRFAVCEQENNRITLWERPPQGPEERPRVVLGQPDFASAGLNNGGVSARSLARPSGVYSDGQRLAVSDAVNSRVLIWNQIPTQNQQPADRVLGQPDMTSAGGNPFGMPRADTLSNPSSVFFNERMFLVADLANNRVLIWNQFPTQDGQPADRVLGQADMSGSFANRQGGPRADTLSAPSFAYSDGTRIFVTDRDNHRVLIWNDLPKSNGQPADVVLGQPGLAIVEANRPPTGSTLLLPRSVHVFDGRLYVADRANNRVLYWNQVPSAHGQSADGVLGQSNLNSILANVGGVSLKTLLFPSGVLATPDILYVADTGNSRIVAISPP
jgi:hypothetical protein